MRTLLYLTTLVAIALVSLGVWTKSTLVQGANSSPQSSVTISIDDVLRTIDVKTLPVQEVKDPV